MDFPKKYDHKTQESHWQSHWEEHGIYRWKNDLPRNETYVIDTPPPTVSGLLHMGHIFSYTHADFIARYQRMKGKDVFYPMGFDDNGLPTERLVEKIHKKRATDYDTREAFIDICMQTSQEARAQFRHLFQSAALSIDWTQEYHTISESSRRISQVSFLDLHKKDEVYRKQQPMLWDPVDQTAIAQAEIEDKELDGTFNDIRFDVDGSNDSFIIGTTRPEMLPACVAIFFHPDDARYAHLLGKQAIVPLFGHNVTIMTDDTVEPDKGTGIMMCCTFGDEADIDKWRTHDLPLRLIINKYGKLMLDDITMDNALKDALQGKKTKAARAIMLEHLHGAGHLVESKPITHAVKCAERSGAPLEIIPTEQWFVHVLKHKDALHANASRCNWKPAWMHKRIEQWIDGLSWDWCISRQRYYGVPFPVWYSQRAGEEGKILLPRRDQLPVNPLVDLPDGYSREDVIADGDVMDTWATSSLSPQLSAAAVTASSAEDEQRFNALFPADLRPQAHEIIRTWAFYTIVKAHLHNDDVPWHNLMISGWCLASDKTKMSKSKGNVVTPVALLEEKGSDAVRFWASTAKLGTDTAFSEDQLKIGAKLVNKLWNASKFAALQLQHLAEPSDNACDARDSGHITHTLDQWLLSRMHTTIKQVDNAFASYDYATARQLIEDIFWNDICDNYLELVKSRAYGNMGSAAQQSACHTILHIFNAVIKLFAPFVPHITETIFSIMYVDEYSALGSIHARGSFPHAAHYPHNADAEQAGIACVHVLELIRKAKSEHSLSIKYPIDEAIITGVPSAIIDSVRDDLCAAGNIAELRISTQGADTAANMHEFSDPSTGITIAVRFAEQSDVA